MWKRQFHGCHPFPKNQELKRRYIAGSDGLLRDDDMYSERQTSAMAELGMGMSQHLKEEKCLQISHCTDLMRKGIEVLIFCQASLLVIAIDDRFQWKSSMVSNLKHISKSIWLVAVTANLFC